MDNNVKKKKAARAKAEEEALNRILSWIAGGSVLEFLLMLLNKYWNHYTAAQIELRVALGTAVKFLAVAGLLCAAAGAFWWNNARRNGNKTGLPAMLGLFMAGVSASCFGAWFFSGIGTTLACIAVPAVMLLAVVHELYPAEFFLVGCDGALGLLGVWVCDRGLSGQYTMLCYAYVAVAVVLMAAAALLSYKAQRQDGELILGGKSLRVFAKGANCTPVYLGTLVALAVLAAAVLGIRAAALYAVSVAWLLVMAVYYTVKII